MVVRWLINLMGLDIFWEDENGEIIEECPSLYNPWRYINDIQELDKTCCLKFIDEYGDTTFNQYQIPVLIEELESLLPRSKDSEARESLESLLTFVRKAENKVHTYIKFYGD